MRRQVDRSMRAFASLLAFSLAVAWPADAAPNRVASLNLCADELLLLIARPDQIHSVTYLSRNAAETPLWRIAQAYQANDGSLLSVAPMRPDLVVTMSGGARDQFRIAANMGIRTIDLPFAHSLAEVEDNIRRLSMVLGRPRAGASLIDRMRKLKQSAPPIRIDTIWLGGGGQTLSADGLGAQWLALAGLRQRSVPGDRVSLETLLARPPDVLVRSQYRQGQYSLLQSWLAHPVAARNRKSRTFAADGRRWTCLGPLMIDEVLRLRQVIR